LKTLEKPIKCIYPKFFPGACVFRPHLCSLHISMVLIVAPRSTVDRAFRTPPTVLLLTEGGGGGGGPESMIRLALIWTAQDRALKSTVNIGFRTPPSILPLMEGGGSGMSDKQSAKICGSETGAQINGPKWISDPPG
jgi:hypothetical protein